MRIPDEAEVLGYFDKLSNHGRWGPDDQLGTLNLITDEKRIEASRLVRIGRTVSCAWDIDTSIQPDDIVPPQRFMFKTGEGLADQHRVHPRGHAERSNASTDYIGFAYHGPRITHLDALSHVSWDHRLYNGHPAETVCATGGATRLDVTSARHGILTRGILLDAARHRGVDWIAPTDDPVGAEEIEEILESRGLTAGPGDAVLLRTGYGWKRTAEGMLPVSAGRSGWQASCLPFFHEHDIALVGSDSVNDVLPYRYPAVKGPLHSVGITAMGLWLLDGAKLEQLADTCAELSRYEFEFILVALPFVGATGAPVNPLAVF
jgi:kynurenine formamidase